MTKPHITHVDFGGGPVEIDVARHIDGSRRLGDLHDALMKDHRRSGHHDPETASLEDIGELIRNALTTAGNHFRGVKGRILEHLLGVQSESLRFYDHLLQSRKTPDVETIQTLRNLLDQSRADLAELHKSPEETIRAAPKPDSKTAAAREPRKARGSSSEAAGPAREAHGFDVSDEEIDASLEFIEPGKVTGGPKSGYRIDEVKIPRRQRRLIDVKDTMTTAELRLGGAGFMKALERITKVVGKKIADIPELKAHWDAARAAVLKGKKVTDYSKEAVIGMYKDAQRRFWDNVREDPKAVNFLNQHGFNLEGERGAAMAALGPQGKKATQRGNITDQERRVSLDHSLEKALANNWMKALDADNLELMFQNANSLKEIVQVKFGMREGARGGQAGQPEPPGHESGRGTR